MRLGTNKLLILAALGWLGCDGIHSNPDAVIDGTGDASDLDTDDPDTSDTLAGDPDVTEVLDSLDPDTWTHPDYYGDDATYIDSGVEPGCGVLTAILRDFGSSHPDFESFTGTEPFEGIVEDTLGVDGKPVYAHAGATAQSSGPESFYQWYRDTPGVNATFLTDLLLEETPVGSGSYVYENSEFYPLDDLGDHEGWPHNYLFTTEIHTLFVYRGGEVFEFRGDDDLWIFINEHLALDLGGLHPPASGSINFDAMASELGIVEGSSYRLDIFHAERHSDQSNFHIETNIDCFFLE